MGFFQKFDEINPKVIYVIMAVALIAPVLKPIGMPITITEQLTTPVYKWMESLQPGDVVFFDSAYSGGSDSELGPQLSAWFYHAMKRGVKVVGVSQWADGAPLAYATLKRVSAEAEKDGYSAKEGTDWVYVGYKAGGVSIWRGMQTDFGKACAYKDYNNVDFKDLPLLAKVPAWDTKATKGLIVFASGSPGVPTYTTYFPDHNIYIGNVAVQVAGSMSLLRSGQVKGVLAGLRGAAEYEKLLGRPGTATKLMDAQSLGHVIIIALIILGNVAYLSKKVSKKKAA